jgi:hypothetical protein
MGRVSLDNERAIQKKLFTFHGGNLMPLQDFVRISAVPIETFALDQSLQQRIV